MPVALFLVQKSQFCDQTVHFRFAKVVGNGVWHEKPRSARSTQFESQRCKICTVYIILNYPRCVKKVVRRCKPLLSGLGWLVTSHKDFTAGHISSFLLHRPRGWRKRPPSALKGRQLPQKLEFCTWTAVVCNDEVCSEQPKTEFHPWK